MSLELESGASVLSCYEIVKLILFLLPFNLGNLSFVQFSRVGAFFFFSCCWCSIAKSCPTLCDPMDCSTPDLPALYYLLEFAQTHVH